MQRGACTLNFSKIMEILWKSQPALSRCYCCCCCSRSWIASLNSWSMHIPLQPHKDVHGCGGSPFLHPQFPRHFPVVHLHTESSLKSRDRIGRVVYTVIGKLSATPFRNIPFLKVGIKHATPQIPTLVSRSQCVQIKCIA